MTTSTYRNYNYRSVQAASIWMTVGVICVFIIGFAWNTYSAEALRNQQILSDSLGDALDSYARNEVAPVVSNAIIEMQGQLQQSPQEPPQQQPVPTVTMAPPTFTPAPPTATPDTTAYIAPNGWIGPVTTRSCLIIFDPYGNVAFLGHSDGRGNVGYVLYTQDGYYMRGGQLFGLYMVDSINKKCQLWPWEW